MSSVGKPHTFHLAEHDGLSIGKFSMIFPNIFDYNPDMSPKKFQDSKLGVSISISALKNSRMKLVVVLDNSVEAESLHGYRTRFERFLTSYTGQPVYALSSHYHLDNKRYELTRKNKVVKKFDVDVSDFNAIFGNTDWIKILIDYVYNFERFSTAAHLHAAYVEYKHKLSDVYFESFIFHILACADSVYFKLIDGVSDSKTVTKEAAYIKFIEDLKELKAKELIDVSGKLWEFIKAKNTKDSYTGDKVDYANRLNFLFEHTREDKLDRALGESINELRNAIAHGKDYDMYDYFNGWSKGDKEYPPINLIVIDRIARACFSAIVSLSKKATQEEAFVQNTTLA